MNILIRLFNESANNIPISFLIGMLGSLFITVVVFPIAIIRYSKELEKKDKEKDDL